MIDVGDEVEQDESDDHSTGPGEPEPRQEAGIVVVGDSRGGDDRQIGRGGRNENGNGHGEVRPARSAPALRPDNRFEDRECGEYDEEEQ
jgi:hypothetical protein